MPRVFWVDSLQRWIVLLALLTAASAGLILGRPSFTNASRPPRFGNAVLALPFVRSVEEIDWTLGDSPSPDREVMRIKQYELLALIACYTALFAALSVLAIRKGGWRQVAGIAAGICGVAAGVFNVLEVHAILNLLGVPLRATTSAMIQAMRGPAAATWILAGVTVALLSVSLIRIPKTS